MKNTEEEQKRHNPGHYTDEEIGYAEHLIDEVESGELDGRAADRIFDHWVRARRARRRVFGDDY